MSELSKKRVRTSLKAIAQFKRACILSSSIRRVIEWLQEIKTADQWAELGTSLL